jgi:ribosome biogenesis protein MAK21
MGGYMWQAAEVDARMLGALLAGVRRAYPYVTSGQADPLAQRHADALFRIAHSAPFGVAVQSLSLLFQLLSAHSALSDRFYRCCPPPRPPLSPSGAPVSHGWSAW